MKRWSSRIALSTLFGLILFVGFNFLRLQWVKFEIRRDAKALSGAEPMNIGETSQLEILPLYEKASLAELQSGHGVSYLIRTDTTTILFDLGNNISTASPSPLVQNMTSLGISMDEIDLIVISHRHPDHVGGQNWYANKTFSIDAVEQPSLGDIPIYIPEEMSYPGSSLSLARNPTQLAAGVATTGIITYAQPFPIWLAMPEGGEQALAVNLSGQGIVIITGCGHMGLKSLLARVDAAFDAPVAGVVGGLHYGNADLAALQPAIQEVRVLNPLIVALSPHDSGPAALDAFAQAFPEAYRPIAAGQPILLGNAAAVR